MRVTFPDLHKAAWTPNIGPSINNAQSTAYMAQALPDGRLLTTNTGSVAYAGGLVGWRQSAPLLDFAGLGLNYAKLSTLILVPSYSAYNLARLETDFLLLIQGAPNAATPIANKFNGSTQLNLSSGNFQIDASSGAAQWSDIGGGPGKQIAPDVPHLLEIRYSFDYAGKKHSTLSISWDGKVYAVPAALQNVDNQTSNWVAGMHIQKQTEMFNPGAVSVIYDQTSLTFDQQPL